MRFWFKFYYYFPFIIIFIFFLIICILNLLIELQYQFFIILNLNLLINGLFCFIFKINFIIITKLESISKYPKVIILALLIDHYFLN